MKKLLLATSAVFALSTVTAVAHADALTFWSFDKGKFTEINEVTQIEKTINVYVNDTIELDSSAQALVAVNSNISGDTVTFASVPQAPLSSGFTDSLAGIPIAGTGVLFTGDQVEMEVHRASLITGSVTHDQGIGQLNQDSGNNSNQGNVISAAFVFDAVPGNVAPTEANGTPVVVPGDVAKAEAYVEQLNTDNQAYDIEGASLGENAPSPIHFNPDGSVASLTPYITADLIDSFDSNIGVMMGNQNAGNMNSQHNALAAAVGDNTFTALSDAGLNQVNNGNLSFDINTVKAENITGSVNDNRGIVAFNQSVGNMNNQATVISVSAIASFAGLP